MVVDPFTVIGTASAVLDLAKFTWKVGSALVKLCYDTKRVDDTVEHLSAEVKSLANECDLVHAELVIIVKTDRNGGPSPYDADERLWRCLTTKVQECSQTVQELSDLIADVTARSSDLVGQTQRQMRLNRKQDELQKIRERVRTHTDGLRTTLLVVNIKVAHLAPGNANRELSRKLDVLQDMVDKLQCSIAGGSRVHSDDTLVQCAREVIAQGTTIYEASVAASSVVGGHCAAKNSIRVANWLGTIEDLRREEMIFDRSDERSTLLSVRSAEDGLGSLTDASSTNPESADEETTSDVESDDELAIDLAKAALEAGNEAFGASDWREADILLQETLRRLKLLPKRQRRFCDTFEIQYRLAVCAFHTQEPVDAEPALTSLFHQVADSDVQRRCVCEAAHLLSVLYVRTKQLERAESACEKALSARRRVFGKHDDATLASTALMARIQQLLGNNTIAKLYMTIIPESHKSAVVTYVDGLLDTDPEVINGIPPSHQTESQDVELERVLGTLNLTRSSLSDDTGICRNDEADPSADATSISTTSNPPSPDKRSGGINVRPPIGTMASSDDSASPQTSNAGAPPLRYRLQVRYRLEVLKDLGIIPPSNPLSRAICNGFKGQGIDKLISKQRRNPNIARLLNTIMPRPTPLHYAAIFGEVDIARKILAVDESELLFFTEVTIEKQQWLVSPLELAFLSLQVEILELFLSRTPRSRLILSQTPIVGFDKFTISSFSKEELENGTTVPYHFIRATNTILRHGWKLEKSFGDSGDYFGSLLDVVLRLFAQYDPSGAIAVFLCEQGVDPDSGNGLVGGTLHSRALNRGLTHYARVFDEHRAKRHPRT